LGALIIMESMFFVEVIRGLCSSDPKDRSRWGDAVSDIRSSMSEDEARAISVLLAHLTVCEANAVARESELHALAELAEWDLMAASMPEVVQRLDPSSLAGSEVEHFEAICGR
jgi:hypothetical protein